MARKKAGRKDRYLTHIEPYFAEIDNLLNDGASEEQVANKLGIAYSTWNKYKQQHEDFRNLCNKPRAKLIEKLRSRLVDRALGMKVEEKKTYIKDDGDKKVKYTEITVKELPPDTTAIFGALNIYDKEYVKDRAQYELKQQELELRKKMAEEDW